MLYLGNMLSITITSRIGISDSWGRGSSLSVPSLFCCQSLRLLVPAGLTDRRAHQHMVERIPFHRTYDIAGWAYEADIHCNDCAYDRFGRQLDSELPPRDQEGNQVQPIFVEKVAEDERCGDCGGALLDSL